MKFSKEEKQKVILGGLFGIAFFYAYFEFGLGPLNKKQDIAQKEVTKLGPKLAEAKKQIESRDRMKARVPQAETVLTQIEQMIPEGSPVAWFPTLIGDFFKARGNERVTTRLLSDVADPAVEGYKRISWSGEITKADAIAGVSVLSEFENQQPLVETPSVLFEFLKEDPQHQRISLTFVNSVRK